MNKNKWNRTLIWAAVSVILIAVAVVLIVTLTDKNTDPTVPTSKVTRGQFSSKLSSTGIVTKVNTDYKIPLAVLLDGEVSDLSDLADADFGISWNKLSGDDEYDFSSPLPIYRIDSINSDYESSSEHKTDEESDLVATLMQMKIDRNKLVLYYIEEQKEDMKPDEHTLLTFLTQELTGEHAEEIRILLESLYRDYNKAGEGTPVDYTELLQSLETLVNYYMTHEDNTLFVELLMKYYVLNDLDPTDLILLLFIEAKYNKIKDDPLALAEAFSRLLVDAKTVHLYSGAIPTIVKNTVNFEAEFLLSAFLPAKGEYILPDTSVFKLTYSQWITTFSLSEYDTTYINTRLKGSERVYASLGVNALNSRKLVAEILDCTYSGNTSGVSYFKLTCRLVFPHLVNEIDEETGETTERGDYSYYDPKLTSDVVEDLGIDREDNISESELLGGYSVTVSAQKTVIADALIVQTKCIYYDDAKNPYLIRLDSELNETIVKIRIDLSTGTQAAVTPIGGESLNAGDTLRYTSDTTLLGSLF